MEWGISMKHKNYRRLIYLCQGVQRIFPGGIQDGLEKLMNDNQ